MSKNRSVTVNQPPPTSTSANEVLAVRHEFSVTDELTAASDQIVLGKLPEGHVLVDAVLDTDDLDSAGSPAVVLDLGFIDGDVDCLIDGTAVARAGGIARMSSVAGVRVAATDAHRDVGVTVVTPPGTDAAGTIGLTLFYKPRQK